MNLKEDLEGVVAGHMRAIERYEDTLKGYSREVAEHVRAARSEIEGLVRLAESDPNAEKALLGRAAILAVGEVALVEHGGDGQNYRLPRIGDHLRLQCQLPSVIRVPTTLPRGRYRIVIAIERVGELAEEEGGYGLV